MKLIIIGPPGSGKGTQTDFLVEKFGVKHISTGDLLRAEVASGSELGKKIDALISRGNLVSDEMVMELLDKATRSAENFLIDGSPRTLYQAEKLCETIDIDAVIYLDVPDEAVKERLGGRWSCPCGEVYHNRTKPPKVPGICDVCGKKLYQRNDDTPEGIQKRLDIFHKNIDPILKYLDDKGLLIKVNGNQTIDEVKEEMLMKLDNS